MTLRKSPSNRPSHYGQLSLNFEKRHGKTIIENYYQLPPLRSGRALHINPKNPSEATVYMVETSGGLVAGDQNKFEINLAEDANVCLIPQSATKAYPSFNGMWSTQNIDVSIGPKATLAWKTEAMIPYETAKFKGKTVINMAKDASLLWGEILAPGRATHGEKLKYENLKTNFQVWLEDECLIYDALSFSPNQTDLGQLGLLENHLYVGSLWFVNPDVEKIDIKQLNEELQKIEGVKVGAALLEKKAVNLRWLASDLVLLKQEMDKVWEVLSDFIIEKKIEI